MTTQEAFRPVGAAAKKPALFCGELPLSQKVFEILYRTPDTDRAINDILGLLGDSFGVSRVYIFEDTPDHLFCSNTYEWCAPGIRPEIQNLQKVSYEQDLGGCYLKNFDEEDLFYCPDISLLAPPQQSLLARQGIFAMLQAAIRENGTFQGYLGFDECTQTLEWSRQQVQELVLTAQIVGTFLCKLRREQALAETNRRLAQSIQALEEERRQTTENERLFQLIVKNSSVSVWNYDIKRKMILQTESSQRQHGLDRAICNVPEALIASGYVHPDSAAAFRAMFGALADGAPQASGVFRVQTADCSGWRYERVQYTTVFDENGRPDKAIAISSDVTAEETQQQWLRQLVDNLPAGIGIYELQNGVLRQQYLNNAFYRMLGDTRESRAAFTEYGVWDAVHPDDVAAAKKQVLGLSHGGDQADLRYRLRNGRGEYVWIRVICNAFRSENGLILLYCSFMNVNQTMQMVQELRKNQELLTVAMQSANIRAWEFDVGARRMLVSDAENTDHPLIVEDVPESLIRSGYVHPDSAADYRALFKCHFVNRRPLKKELQVQNADRTGYCWLQHILVPVYDAAGVLTGVVGTTVDITEQKRLQEKYFQQLRQLEGLKSPNLVAKIWYNLTQNRMESATRAVSSILPYGERTDYDSGLLAAEVLCLCGRDRRQLRRLFNRPRLIEEFYKGNTEFSFEYQRKNARGQAAWVLNQCKTFQEPASGDIMCFIYCFDTNQQRTTQEMMDAVVRLNYDYLALLDCRTHDYLVFANQTAASPLPPFHTDEYETEVQSYAHQYIADEDVERNIEEMSIENIRRQLGEKDRFSSYAKVKEADGSISRKMMQFSYMDRANEKVLISRVDTTDIYLREQEQMSELKAAKEEAERASGVKSAFLSRMSHDLRTPLNAIMGVTQLAAQELDDPKAVCQYLDNIHSAGQYLLALVNDCLDFEKISAGRMVLHPTSYSYRRLCTALRTIMEPLCRAKNISLILGECPKDCAIWVDAIRLEQIFLNLLTNAVKFTPPGGTVEFFVACTDPSGPLARCDFTVRDNGIGMSPAFQARMFEPFEQESSDISTQSQGSGLGLSIVKNIVELMGGTIRVQSEKGRGSCFTVHLDLPLISAEAAAEALAEPAVLLPAVQQTPSLAGAHLLLVEDNSINMMIAKKLLERWGMVVTCAADGEEGVRRFASSAPGEFAAVLMDVRMPHMDGLTAAQTMRALPRPDASLPILAMSANVFEEDRNRSLAAGMNEHLAKPIDPELLHQTLLRWVGQRC